MFSQKKRNLTWIYVCIILLIAVIAVFILIGALSNKNAEDAERTNLESKVSEENQSEPNADNATNVQEPEDSKSDAEKFYQSYYLVKYDNNVIKIYFSDETGKLTELESTSIVYETLSQGDQAKFREGIKVENRDDLNRLMMDYES
ncbi:Uncharacterised protein [uncultured Eubacterium sp.]|nr:Uncharacterised protein [uncultured Eubacterium sp.]